MDYFYSAAERRLRGALWPSFALALITRHLTMLFLAARSRVPMPAIVSQPHLNHCLYQGKRMSGKAINSPSETRNDDNAFERHYTPKQLSELWILDESTIRRLFHDEPGVLKYSHSSLRSGRREYVTLRIPESVVKRVYARRRR